MSFYTNYIFVSICINKNDINDTILKAGEDSFWRRIIRNRNNLLRVSFGPFFNKFGRALLCLPCLNATYFHEFSSLILPGKFGISNLCVQSVNWTHICNSDNISLLLLDEIIIPNTFCLALNWVLKQKFWWIYHHLWSIFIQLQELFNGVRVHEIVSDDYFSQKLFQAFSSVIKIFVFHFEQEAFSWELRDVVIIIFKSFLKIIELRKSFLNIPLVIFALYFDCKIDGILFSFDFLKSGDWDSDSRG